MFLDFTQQLTRVKYSFYKYLSKESKKQITQIPQLLAYVPLWRHPLPLEQIVS